ncbi:ATP-binding protein [Flavobacteriaceae bacterium]|nr:ATP-binding protein [Flavobacteriaceae bacterium]MDC1539145.1 ATP-binding protein [Flavobacteriaceae bacterium]
MNKPSHKELERQIKALEETIKRLNKDHQQIHQFFDSVPKNVKIIELIREGKEEVQDYYYRYVNKAFTELVGKTKSQLIGKRYKELFEPVDSYWLEIYNKIVNTRKSVNYQNTHSSNGRYFEVFSWIIEKNMIAVIFADITERKLKDLKILNDKEKAEKNERIKNDFISNLSHEIRTPMNGILGFTKFLNDPNLAEVKRKHYISIIQNSGHQLLRTIDDLIEISKITSNQVAAIKNEVCLNNLLLELFTIFDLKAKENNTPLYLRKGLSDKDSFILTDAAKLNSIISNLLENALKFTNEGSIEFGYTKTDENLELYVKDTGVGIKLSRQKSIFDRFTQEEKEIKNNFGGLGLGLSIAKENTKLLGGKITVKSKKGKGAIFFVTIPYTPTHYEVSTYASGQTIKDNSKHHCKILIAEDEEINYLYLEILLKDKISLDCAIIHAKDGEEAVSICNTQPEIDFVLMDLKMPNMNGFEALKLIKKGRPELPIVAQTAFSSAEDIEKIKAAGFDDYISKPISQEALTAVIERTRKRKEKNTLK